MPCVCPFVLRGGPVEPPGVVLPIRGLCSRSGPKHGPFSSGCNSTTGFGGGVASARETPEKRPRDAPLTGGGTGTKKAPERGLVLRLCVWQVHGPSVWFDVRLRVQPIGQLPRLGIRTLARHTDRCALLFPSFGFARTDAKMLGYNRPGPEGNGNASSHSASSRTSSPQLEQVKDSARPWPCSISSSSMTNSYVAAKISGLQG